MQHAGVPSVREQHDSVALQKIGPQHVWPLGIQALPQVTKPCEEQLDPPPDRPLLSWQTYPPPAPIWHVCRAVEQVVMPSGQQVQAEMTLPPPQGMLPLNAFAAIGRIWQMTDWRVERDGARLDAVAMATV